MTSLSIFQTVLLIAFGFLLIVGVLIFAGVLPGFRSPPGGLGGTVVWWGTVPEERIQSLLRSFQEENKSDFTLVYTAKDPRTLENEFVEALARGAGPDLISFPHELILKHGDKLWPIPYESVPLRGFQETFIAAGELYLTPQGVLGLPFYLDPLVLYYNEDLLADASIAFPSGTWGEIQMQAAVLNKFDQAGNFLQHAIGIGNFNNVTRAKEILSLLILQTGNPIVFSSAGRPQAVLHESFGLGSQPAAEALAFFNRFVDPANSLYSWHSALPEDRAVFLSGSLAMYLGFASEYGRLRQQNPQLSFDVALVPQRGIGPNLTFSRVTALAVVANSRNRSTALRTVFALTGREFAKEFSDAISLPPARRDLLNRGHADPTKEIFYRSAIVGRGWLDPDPQSSLAIFRKMAEDSQSGRRRPAQALEQAQLELKSLLP